eukprot:1147305-Pelagomonas_calceolata.AAC.3
MLIKHHLESIWSIEQWRGTECACAHHLQSRSFSVLVLPLPLSSGALLGSVFLEDIRNGSIGDIQSTNSEKFP